MEKDKLRKEQLNKEKIELDDLETSHLDFKRIKIKIFTAWRVYSLEKTTYVIGKSFANTLERQQIRIFSQRKSSLKRLSI